MVNTINHYGIEHQRDKLCEEFRELQDELYYLQEHEYHRTNLLSEGVDVINLTLQFLFSRGFTEDDVIQELSFKVNRQTKRIKEENIKNYKEDII